MKAKQHSLNCYTLYITFFILSIIFGLTSVNAQCPTVTNSSQSLCDVQSVLVGDLQATDTGGGIVWYETANSTTPLSNSENLISGQDYYADDSSGTCGARARVDIIIYGPPIGNNFQGVCLDDPTLATVGSLVATGNDVQWYLSPSGGIPLNDNTILIDDTLYYADQANPNGSCRTSRLSVLVKVGSTSMPTGDMIQEFCTTTTFTPTVQDLVASGMNNWYISLFSALPLPASTPLINGQTYYVTTIDPPCESAARLAVTALLVTGPNAGEDGTLEICDNNFGSTFNLFASLEGSPDSGGTWSPTLNSGTGIYDPNTDPVGEYTYTVNSSNSCPNESAAVMVSIIAEPNAGISGAIDLCDIDDAVDLFSILTGSPESNGSWSPALASGTGLFNPAIDTDGIYTYTVNGTGPCADANATVTVSVIPYKDAGEDGFIDICNNIGTINLFDSLGGTPDTGGTWNPELNSGTGVFDPLVDTAGTYIYFFTGNAPCPDDFATVTVAVVALPIAGSDATLTLCSNDLATVNLFDTLGATAEAGGTWSPALASGTSIFNPSMDSAGTYVYTLTGTVPCTDVSANVDVLIIQEPDAGTNASVNICTNNGTINLFDTLEGTPEGGGIWSPLLNSNSNIFDPLVDPVGTYTYTVTGTSPCADATATVTISVTPFQNAGTDGSITVCNNDGPIDLFDSLGGAPEAGGTWSPALTSNTGIFNPSVDTAGIYTYTTSGTGPCSDDQATVDVSVEIAPNAGTDATVNICSNNGTSDLFDSLGGSPEVGGTWSPSLASGTNIFDPLVDTDDTYTYTVTGTSPCADANATITITVSEFQSAGTDGAVTVCTDDGTIDLFDNLGGSPEGGGIWTPTLTSGTGIFDPLVDTANTYTYTTSSTGPCIEDSANVEVSVEIAPDAGVDGTLNLCSLSDSSDLFDSLGGTPQTGGIWSPSLTSGTGVFDASSDPEGIYTYTVSSIICGNSIATVTVSVTDANDAGNSGVIDVCYNAAAIDLFNSLGGVPDVGGIWSPMLTSGSGIFDPSVDAANTYTYTVSNSANLCPDDSATVIVSVLQGPNAGNNGTLNLCDVTNTIDLINGLSGTPETGGTWSPALTSGTGVFDPNTDPEGIYTYTLSNSCGTNSATVTVSLSDVNDAGENGTVELCINDASVDLFNILGGTPDVGGTWTPALTSGTGIFDPTVDTAGNYTYTVSSGITACPSDSSIVSVSILQGPNAGNNGTLNLCDSTNTIDLINGLSGSPETGGTWSPVLTSGTGVFDPNTDAEGIYTYTLNSTCGTNSATVSVSLSDVNDAGTNGTLELCATDASIDLFNSLGGTPDVGGTWTPTLSSTTGVFDPMIDIADIYTYTVSSNTTLCPDATATVTVSILQGPNAGSDGTLNLCNSVNTIDLINGLSGSPETGGTWTPALSSGTGVFDPNTDPEGTYTYTLSNTCGTNSATVNVSLSNVNDAGENGILELCDTDTSVDLYNSLGGTPDVGGTWTPALSSTTGIFDPMTDVAGVYTYTISGASTTCPDASATVTVSILPGLDAGTNGVLNLCNSTNTVDLFNSLTGSPDTGGTWSPAMTSGTGVFDPTMDTEGIYTYTLTNSCGTNSATVTVSLSSTNDAGTDGAIELCSSDAAIDLFNILGGTPQTGGTWLPVLNSGTGVFDPIIDTADTYVYTISSGTGSTCPDASASVVVTFTQAPNAGSDGTLDICLDDSSSVNLIDSIGGTPDAGGVWSPVLTSGTGMFDPIIDADGIYTYTVTNTCRSTFATLTVSISNANDAGANGSIELCTDATPTDLFNSLDGTPQIGGTWSPELTSTTGVFDPMVDAAGIYTYAVSDINSTCPEATATVEVTIIEAPNAGIDGGLNICADDTDSVNLFESLGGTPEVDGVWSPVLASGTGVFDPTMDTAGVFTYTVTSTECSLTASANITVSILDLPDVTGFFMSMDDDVVCIGEEDAIVSITNANQLPDGDFTIVYQLTESNVSVNTASISVAGGNATFTIPQTLLQNPGLTMVTLRNLFVLGQTCSAITDAVEPLKLLVQDLPTPVLIENGTAFCLEDNSTISDLSNNVSNIDWETEIVIWYDQLEEGTPYADSEVLHDGNVYYGSIRSIYGCESNFRSEVTISNTTCIGDLLIPDGFSPNNDGINDVFDILFISDLHPNFKLSIYNRYGNILYEGNKNSPQWDGTWKNSDTVLPVGVYFYIIEFNDGETESVQGRVYLSR